MALALIFADQEGMSILNYEVDNETLRFTSVVPMRLLEMELTSDSAKSRIIIYDYQDPTYPIEYYKDYCLLDKYTEHIEDADNKYYEYVLRKVDKAKITEDKLMGAIAAAQLYAQTLDDRKAIQCSRIYPDWTGEAHKAGDKVSYFKTPYKCTADVEADAWDGPGWDTDHWELVCATEPGWASVWRRVIGINGYKVGANVLYEPNGKFYRNTAAFNVKEPTTEGSGWTEILMLAVQTPFSVQAPESGPEEQEENNG